MPGRGGAIDVNSNGQWGQVEYGSYVDIENVNVTTMYTRDNHYCAYLFCKLYKLSFTNFFFEVTLPGSAPNTLTTFYIIGEEYGPIFWTSEQVTLPSEVLQEPVCAHGYLESTGYCNCYSG